MWLFASPYVVSQPYFDLVILYFSFRCAHNEVIFFILVCSKCQGYIAGGLISSKRMRFVYFHLQMDGLKLYFQKLLRLCLPEADTVHSDQLFGMVYYCRF